MTNKEEEKAIIDRLNAERKKHAGKWHNDRYYLGYTDALRKAIKIVNGTIDEPEMYAPANTEDAAICFGGLEA